MQPTFEILQSSIGYLMMCAAAKDRHIHPAAFHYKFIFMTKLSAQHFKPVVFIKNCGRSLSRN
jgi:hypothetical protein